MKGRLQGSQHNHKLPFTECHASTPPLDRVLQGHVHSLGLQQTGQLVSTKYDELVMQYVQRT